MCYENNLQEFIITELSKTSKDKKAFGICHGIYYSNIPLENLFPSIDEFVKVKSKELSIYLRKSKILESEAIMNMFGIPEKDCQTKNKKRYKVRSK